jgi:hypothetical protein
MEGRLTGQRAGRWRARPGGAVAREVGVDRQAQVVVGRATGGGVHGRGRHGTGRRRWMRAAMGSAGQVVWLGLVVNGPTGCGNIEKLIFGGPLGFWLLVN